MKVLWKAASMLSKLPFIASRMLDAEVHGKTLLASPTVILGISILMQHCVLLLSDTVSLKLAYASA